uniref:PIH1D1/2/3 CS-like domain-containing protein n=1 Tax=Strigamia maritima TaxID=126957 RepID=T1IHK1_STRMM
MDFGPCDILKLRDLLENSQPQSKDVDSDSEDDRKSKPYEKITTASSASLAKSKSKEQPPAADLNSKPAPYKKPPSAEKVPFDDEKDSYDPFDYDAIEKWQKKQEELELDKLKEDLRVQPDYEIIYKQQVSTEDVYLQLGNKTPCSSSCESIAIRIKLPKTNSRNIKLDVQKQSLDLETKDFLLQLPLPHPVHPQKGGAAWDEDNQTLIVTLFLDREYDFINF